jgi:hypothetical protein
MIFFSEFDGNIRVLADEGIGISVWYILNFYRNGKQTRRQEV